MRTRWALLAGLALAALIGGGWWLLGGDRSPRRAGLPERAPGGFVGSEPCRQCHPKIYDEWRASSHYRNMDRPSTETVVGDFEGANTYTFRGTRSRMYRAGDRWLMDYQRAGAEVETFTVDWVSGIARHQIYLHAQPDGRLQVLPTYWNVEEGAWRDSLEGAVAVPGEDWAGAEDPLPRTHPQYWENHGRTWNLVCMECHASQGRKHYDAARNTYESAFDPHINCESCHGPGQAHCAAWAELRPNPGGDHVAGGALEKLGGYDLARSVEICAVCHARKRIYRLGFEPGDSFYDYFAPDVWEPGAFYVDGRSSSLNYRYVDFMQSRCFRRSERKLDCGFCHPPHALSSVRGKTVVESNAVCTACHLQHKTQLTEHTHHRPESAGSRCVECHMPPMDLDLRMTVRDHTISSPLPVLTARYQVPNACGTCHPDKPVEWAQRAVGEWYGDAESYRRYRARMLDRAAVLSRAFGLGGGAAGGGSVPVAELAAWLDDPSASLVERASAAKLLGAAAGSELALEVLLRHARDPHPLVRYYVVESLGVFPHPKALSALRVALADERRIVRVDAYRSLFYRQPGIEQEIDPVVARARAEHRHRRDVLRADDPRDKSELALFYFSQGDAAAAERLLRQGAALTQRTPGVASDLARYLIAVRRLDEAEVIVQGLERLDPSGLAAGLGRANLLIAQRRPREAAEVYERLLRAGHDTVFIRQAREQALRQANTP